MSRRATQLGSGLLLLLLAVSAWAQAPQAAVTATPPFAQLDQMLSGRADDLLAKSSQIQPAVLPPQTDQPAATHDSLQAGRLRADVERVRQLRPVIEPILREQGLPPELSAVVLVESGGQATALSPKGARGLWQLMPDTARRYGLVVTPEHDERLDVLKSTRAAARYLHDLYSQFGDWSKVLAAYNAGEQIVSGLLKQTGRNDFEAISYRLPNETRNYVPAVLTAMKWFGSSRPQVNRPAPADRVLFASFTWGE